MNWTSVDIPQHQQDSNGNKMADDGMAYDSLMESVVRITAAGFAGAMVGLSYQKRAAGSKIFQRSLLYPTSRNSAPTKADDRANCTSTSSTRIKKHVARKLPSTAPALRSAPSGGSGLPGDTNLPLQWAMSFGAFVSILETSRFWSPSTFAIKHLYNDDVGAGNRPDGNERSDKDIASATSRETVYGARSNNEVTQETQRDVTSTAALETRTLLLLSERQQHSVATILDYTLGGAVAGMAGGISKRRPPPASSSTSQLQLPFSIVKGGRRSLLLWGIGTGVMLGFFAGVCQAGLEVAEDCVRAEELRQEEEFGRQVQERRDEKQCREQEE